MLTVSDWFAFNSFQLFLKNSVVKTLLRQQSINRNSN